jgi:hypothetical protein
MEKFNIKNGLSVGTNKLDVLDSSASLSATSITLSGTAVTSTATELNHLNGVTGITLGSTNEILLVGGDGSSIASDGTLSVDSASNFVGINQTSPEVTLHMTGQGPQTAQIRMEQYNDSADAPDVRTRRYRGTIDEPAAVQSGDYLFRSNHEYWNGTSLLIGGAFAFDNTNNAARTQFSVAVDTDGTGANPQGNNGQFKIDGNDSGAITFNNAYKFPTADGSANQILQTNGAGDLSFSSNYATSAQGALADSALQSTDIDTLTELNTIVTDATLIDTTDSRLSDSRACDNTFDDAATARANLGLGNVENTSDATKFNNLIGPQTLTSSTSVSWDCNSGRSAVLTMAHDVQLQVPTNLPDGHTASLSIIQDESGGRELTLATGMSIMTGNLGDVGNMSPGGKAEVSVKRVGTDYRIFIVIAT